MFIEILFFIFLGLSLGSFATAVTHRELKGQSWWSVLAKKGRETHSQCPQCKHQLGLKDLIPVFSWVFQRGKCRYCGHKIPLFYVITEASLAIACAIIGAKLGLNDVSIIFCAMVPFAYALGVFFYKKKALSFRLLLIILGLLCMLVGAVIL